MIHVTSPYLPSIKKYTKYIEDIYERKWLTNNGPLVKELTARLEAYLGVKNLLLVSSGTMALQVAFRIKNLAHKRVLTTPFTFQATYSSLEWQGAEITLSDIADDNWNLDPLNLRDTIKNSDNGIDCIVPVHTFGSPCNINEFERLQKEFKFDLIYDASHAVTTKSSNGDSLLKFGDISCFSLHATKLLHTIEGGGIVFKDPEEHQKAQKMINFGLQDNQAVLCGINGKMSEFHAAMGLAVLDDLDIIIKNREEQISLYKNRLEHIVDFQKHFEDYTISPSYMPVLFKSENDVIRAQNELNRHNIFPRRYFYPPVNKMPYTFEKYNELGLKNSNSISSRILCLPLYYKQELRQIDTISEKLISALK